jgi:hypothetical protein
MLAACWRRSGRHRAGHVGLNSLFLLNCFVRAAAAISRQAFAGMVRALAPTPGITMGKSGEINCILQYFGGDFNC